MTEPVPIPTICQCGSDLVSDVFPVNGQGEFHVRCEACRLIWTREYGWHDPEAKRWP